MFLALNYWKPLAAVAALLALFAWHKWQVWSAYDDGVKAEEMRARIEAGRRITEMEENNEEFRKLPARERCRLFLRDSGLPEHHCDAQPR